MSTVPRKLNANSNLWSVAGKVVCHTILGIYLFTSNRRRDRQQQRDSSDNESDKQIIREEAADFGMLDKTEASSNAFGFI